MFAVLKTGGKQYKVSSGDVLRVEKLDAVSGDTIQFNDVLMVGSTVGAPFVDDAAVQAEVIDQIKGEKTINFVKRRRKHSSARKKGHRQQLTLVRIGDILEKGASKSGVKSAVSGAGIAMTAAIRTNTAVPKAPVEKTAVKKVAASKAAEQAVAESGSTGTKPANALTEARGGQADDLKKISGVGPALEKKLHANGVFHFDQIAAWTADEIAYMDDQLSFKGRIERDEWTKQATEFAKG